MVLLFLQFLFVVLGAVSKHFNLSANIISIEKLVSLISVISPRRAVLQELSFFLSLL